MTQATRSRRSSRGYQLQTTEWKRYVCPYTHAPLLRDGDRLVSPRAAKSYRVRDGVPWFLRYDPVEDDETVSMLDDLNRVAREKGWLDALKKHCPERVRYVTDSGRLSYIDLLPMTGIDRVLEIGPGLAQHTCRLATLAKAVHALEVVPQQAAFALERCRQSGADNVLVACGGDDCRLPYEDECFDLAVANLVFEWCATRAKGVDAATGQRRLLGELSRVLRPGGALFLSTKNRYALRLLLGRRDEHAYGMPFGNALPRWLMERCMPSGAPGQARGLLHSYCALRRMLKRSGFADMQSYWAVPDMRWPERFIGTDPESIAAARNQPGFSQGDSRSSRLIQFVPARMVKYLAPGLSFLVRKPCAAGPTEKQKA